VAALMYVALLVVLRDALRRRRAAGGGEDGASDLADPLKVVALTLGYVAAFQPLGYALATVPYVFLLFQVFRFEDRSHLKRLAYALVITAVFYGLFAGVFNIRLPLPEALL
jgi:putative tricarboxylic transport membrane protein